MKAINLTLEEAKSFWNSGNEKLAEIALKGFSREELESSTITRCVQLTQEEYNLFSKIVK
jgi:hypothetical protein